MKKIIFSLIIFLIIILLAIGVLTNKKENTDLKNISHVIISCGGTTPPDDTVTQAAQLAAYYSEATGGQNIAVDATQVKQVKKTPSGKPGMVIYHTYRTVIVNPYKDIVVDPLNAEKKEEQ